jgi:hypothetical protein
MKRQQNDTTTARLRAIAQQSQKIVRARQDSRAKAEGELQIKGVMRNYFRWTKNGGGASTKEEMATCPEREMVPKKDGTGSFPGRIGINVTLHELTPVKDQCVHDAEHNKWRVLVAVTYKPDAARWLQDHLDEYRAGRYEGTFPVGEYFDDHGQLVKTKWIEVFPNMLLTCRVRDPDEGNIWRAKNRDTGNWEVTPRTVLTLTRCEATQNVTLVKEEQPAAAAPVKAEAPGIDGQATEDVAPPVVRFKPQCYVTFDCNGGAEIDANHDASLPETERIHATENKDVHLLAPVEDIISGRKQVPQTVYFWTQDGYCSPSPAERGIYINRIPIEDPRDLVRTAPNGVQTALVTIRMNYMQWFGSPDNTDGLEQYALMLTTGGSPKYANPHTTNLWRNFGIGDKEAYGLILTANQDIPCHVEASLWRSSLGQQLVNRSEQLNDRDEVQYMRGYYTFGIKTVVPDYLRYLPTSAIRLTPERVEAEFADWAGNVGKEKRKTIILQGHTANAHNPLVAAMGLASPVVPLGNGQSQANHGVVGDVWPLFADYDFYVLTSRPPTDADRAATEDGDAVLDRLIGEHKVAYWIFAVNRRVAAAIASNKRHRVAATGDDNDE